jgi:hypothetical protein
VYTEGRAAQSKRTNRYARSGHPGDDSAPGWLGTAYDEHPGADGNHHAGRDRRSPVHSTGGVPIVARAGSTARPRVRCGGTRLAREGETA